ncbi:MAG: hypothetical protein J7K72_02775, partial [Candidatus Aenigmarchaeota archaeon]|nr:hypothetical protein [Candidatus Aenigmarchaeota archaeon]
MDMRFLGVLLLGLVFLGLGLGVISGGGGWLQEIQEKLADFFSKGETTTADYEIAKRSACYLACAINSVITGEEKDCSCESGG